MKTFLFAVFFVLTAMVTTAQTTVDARLGGTLSGLSEGDWTMKFGLKAGLGVDHAFTDLFALRSGLFFELLDHAHVLSCDEDAILADHLRVQQIAPLAVKEVLQRRDAIAR